MGTDKFNESTGGTLTSESPTIHDPDVVDGCERVGSAHRLEAGNLLNGRYEIIRLLGKGGMGEVYLAADIRINRNVAIKVLPRDLISSEEGLSRFMQEAEAVSALNHPHILTIHEVDTTADGVVFFVSEFVDGQTLNLVALKGIEQVLEIALQIGSALSAAHEAGIVHRDIKPENVMVRRDGYAKVLDFGLAKLAERKGRSASSGSEDPTRGLLKTKLGSVVGTPAYMSPEQARGLRVDERTDIWSLGVLLYELITGERPFRGETPADVVVSVLMSDPSPPSTFTGHSDPELDRVVGKALAKDVEARYQTIAEFRGDLERVKKRLDFRSDDTASFGLSSTAEPNPSRARERGDRAATTEIAGNTDGSTLVGVHGGSSRRRQAPGLGARRRFAVAVAGAVLILLGGALWLTRSGSGGGPIRSIAVLPFENLTGDAELTYLSDGISEKLIDKFSELPQLTVISRSSSFKLRGVAIEPRDAAARLGVGAIVSGSVARDGDEMLIRFEIIDAGEDRHLAGGQFRRKAGDLLRIQSEIAQRAAELLRLQLSDSQTSRIANDGTTDSEAFRYYLSGLVELNGPQDVRGRALEYFEKAVSLDPNFADAHAEIAWVLWARANGSSDPTELVPKAKAALERAVSADANHAKARVVAAMMKEYEFDWAGAEAEYKQAIELNPNLDFARNNYGFFLSVMGRQDEALAELEQQRLRDPINARLGLLQKGIVLTQARRFDEALKAYQEAQAIEPGRDIPNFSLGYAYAGKGSMSEAAEYYKRSVDALGGEDKYSQPLVYLTAAYAEIEGKRDEARKILARIEARERYASPALLAAAHAALGDRDRAMVLLEEAYIKRDPLLRFIGTGYEYDPLRQDPRFTNLLNRIGLSN
jgi:eukaryotic-like serine/threonine-protein kinase